MRIKQSLGQNFLLHASIAERMVEASGVPATTRILEIGPGKGLLTRVLLARGYSVTALETDADLIPVLEETFAIEVESGQLRLLKTDVRAFDATTIAEDYAIIANIPYYITGEIIRQFLESAHKPASMTLLVQKEVAERIARSKKGSLLSLAVAAYGKARYCFTVSRGAFFPAPNVDSAVLCIDHINPASFGGLAEESRFFEVLRAGFAHKRKLLRRNLEVVAVPEKITEAFLAAHISPSARSEDVPLESWKSLATHLTQEK